MVLNMMISKKKILIYSGILLLPVLLYRFSPRRIEFLGYYDKVLAHRVNSLGKLESALPFFSGVELDIDYLAKTNILDVNHHPAKSINLSFETYLNHINTEILPFLWLDIKDLNATNADAILLKLNTLFDAKHYPKDKVLIETQHPEALVKFIEEGYKTSYYIPPQLYKKDEKELKNELIKIKLILNRHPKMAISTSILDYDIVSVNLPKKNKYIWSDASVYRIKYTKTKVVLKDDSVKKVLITFNSFRGNR